MSRCFLIRSCATAAQYGVRLLIVAVSECSLGQLLVCFGWRSADAGYDGSGSFLPRSQPLTIVHFRAAKKRFFSARRTHALGRMAVQLVLGELHSRQIAPWRDHMNLAGFFWQFLLGVGHDRCQYPNYVVEQTVGRDRGVF